MLAVVAFNRSMTGTNGTVISGTNPRSKVTYL